MSQRTLVPGGVNNTPHRRPHGRNHGYNPPVRAKVLDAPDHGDDEGDQRERGAVSEADEGGCGVEGRGLGEWERGGEEEVPQGQDEGGREEKGKAGEGWAGGSGLGGRGGIGVLGMDGGGCGGEKIGEESREEAGDGGCESNDCDVS